MPAKLQISYRNMEASDSVERQVRERVAQLEKFYDRLIACRVVLEGIGRHHRKGRLFDVRAELAVPGREIVATREPSEDHAHEDAHVAIRDAFDAARRQLEDYVRRMDNRVKTHQEEAFGRVIKLFPERGYGFRATDAGDEVYMQRNSVIQGSFDDLCVGDRVRYVVDPEEGEKGPQASTVVPLSRHG
jgi:ribosomal subunit interface protein